MTSWVATWRWSVDPTNDLLTDHDASGRVGVVGARTEPLAELLIACADYEGHVSSPGRTEPDDAIGNFAKLRRHPGHTGYLS